MLEEIDYPIILHLIFVQWLYVLQSWFKSNALHYWINDVIIRTVCNRHDTTFYEFITGLKKIKDAKAIFLPIDEIDYQEFNNL